MMYLLSLCLNCHHVEVTIPAKMLVACNLINLAKVSPHKTAFLKYSCCLVFCGANGALPVSSDLFAADIGKCRQFNQPMPNWKKTARERGRFQFAVRVWKNKITASVLFFYQILKQRRHLPFPKSTRNTLGSDSNPSAVLLDTSNIRCHLNNSPNVKNTIPWHELWSALMEPCQIMTEIK